jgi:NADH-quinone oxidoreductase subunit A
VEEPLPEQYYPVLLALGVAIALGAVILTVSHLLSLFVGNQRGGIVKRTTIESGMPLLDTSHKRISIAFFLVAIDFIVFDLEAAFLYPWSLIVREGGWELFWAVMVFIFLILVGFAYVWLKGGLDISAPARERRPLRLYL